MIVLVSALASPALAQDDEIGIPLGASPPAVTIEDLDGKPVNLSDYVGKKPVLLEFWATWCPICAGLFPRIEAAHARYKDRVQFLVVAVAVNETPRSIRRDLERHPLPFPVLWDTNGNAVRAFHAPGTSYVVVLDTAGKVVYTGYGEEQDIEAAVGRALPL
ncbi:MAG: TlpA family protein disulfide reductase [Gemmatimonadetes bacterium]|nr:TlpA family protein disulfide reductase [Gemmatimonadota bacterium]